MTVPVRRKLLMTGFLLVLLGATATIMMTHSFFRIHTITVTGNERIATTDIVDTTKRLLSYKLFSLFPADNYFLTQPTDVRLALESSFPLQEIEVKKAFPNQLQIALKEKISTIIYDDGENFFYVGPDGKIVQTILFDEIPAGARVVALTSTTVSHTLNAEALRKKFGSFPIVYQPITDTEKKINTQIFSPLVTKSILLWHEFLSKRAHLSVAHFSLENKQGSGQIVLADRSKLYVTFGNNDEQQFERLMVAIREMKFNEKKTALQYIDLRYPGRVYWQ